MPKYWVKNYFTHGRFPKVGQKQKNGGEKKIIKERPKVGDKNGQATHGARKPPGPIIFSDSFSFCKFCFLSIRNEMNHSMNLNRRADNRKSDFNTRNITQLIYHLAMRTSTLVFFQA